MKSKKNRPYTLSHSSHPEQWIKPGLFLLVLLLAGLLLATPASAASQTFQTTEVTVVKLAEDGETVLDERTVDYRWMEENLPVVGDGVTHYYMQGITCDLDNLWDPDEKENIVDYHAMRGTDVRDLCNLVGGMGPDDIIYIYPNDNYGAARHPYKNVYYTDTEHGGNPEQGPLVLTWWRPDDGYVPDYQSGMRTFFFATTTNADGQYVFGNDDMRRFLDKEYWTFYEEFPCSKSQCQKYVKKIEIKSHEPVPLFPITVEADQTTGYFPLTVQFTGTTEAESPKAWHWDFGDGTSADGQNPTHTYEEAGLFDVSLTVTAADGTATKTRHQFIAAQERPVATTLDVFPPEAMVTIDGTQVFTAMVRDQKGRVMKDVAVEWSSSNTTVGTIDDGVFTALAEGTTTVTASTAGISGTAEVSVVPVPPEPKTWYVDDDGPANFTSIQEAVYACNPGDTVVVKDGEYTENVVVDRPIVLRSENGPETTVVTAKSVVKPPIMVTGNNAAVSGLTVQQTGNPAAGIGLEGAENCTVEGNVATGCYRGIFLNSSASCTLRGNHVTSIDEEGIVLSSSSENTIVDNTIKRLKIISSNTTTIANNTIEGGTHGIRMISSDNSTITHNRVSASSSFYLKSSSNNTISRNTLNGGWGFIFEAKTADNEIYLNSVLCDTGLSYHYSAMYPNNWNSTVPLDYSYNNTDQKGYLGNYWNCAQPDADLNGIGDSPHKMGYREVYDTYPLVASAENYKILPPMQTIVHGPYITGTTGTETTINWRTDVPTAGRVDYAPAAAYSDGNYTLNVTDGEETCLHHVGLTGLKPGTTYHYQVTAGRNVTQDFTFETFPEAGEKFTFITYGDSQEQKPYYTQLEMHKLVADRIAEEEEDALFILHLGDTVSQADDPTEWDRFFASAKPMLANTTLYTVLGNHEEDYKDLADTTFALPPWYSFDCGDLHVVVLDSTGMKASEMAEQTKWLKDDLTADEARWTVGAFHHPPYNSGGHHASGWPDTKWQEVFKEKGTAAIFNGHVHSYQRHADNGTQFLTVATGGGMQYELNEEKEPEYQAGMEYILGYERVTVDPVNATVTMEFVPVADITDGGKKVGDIRPPGEVFDRVVIGGAGGVDLAPVKITTDGPAVAGENATVVVTVKNIGGTEAGGFAVNLTVDDAPLGTQEAENLPAGATATFAFAWAPTESGPHTFVAMVEGPPGEYERENNMMKKRLYVLSPGEGPAFKEGAIELAPGWNLVSVPKRLVPGNDTALIFSEVDSAGHSLCIFDAGTQCWQAIGPDDKVTPLTGVLVYAEDAAAVPLTFDTDPVHAPPAKSLSKGWNFVGTAGTDPEPAALALVSAEGQWEQCTGYDALRQVYEASVTADLPDHALFPGRGYWLGMNENGTLAGTAL